MGVDHIIFQAEINSFGLIRDTVLYLWFLNRGIYNDDCRVVAWLQVASTLGHHTLVYSTMPSRQPLSVDKTCQGLDVQAGGQADRQADSAVWYRQDSESDGWAMVDDSLSSSINRHLSKSLRLFGDAADTTHWRQYWQTQS